MAILKPSSSAPALQETRFRLQGELLAIGVEVQLLQRPKHAESDADDLRDALKRLASERGIDAIIDIQGEDAAAAVDIWIFHQAPNPAEVSRVLVEADRDSSAETLAIRAIEVLRSRLVEIDLAARRREGRPSKPSTETEAPRTAARPSEHFGVAAGIALLTSLDRVGPAVLPLLRLAWVPHPQFTLEATAAGLGSRPNVMSDLGRARVAQDYALLGVCYCQPNEPGLRPIATLAAGALRTSLTGEANAPGTGHAVAQWSFLMQASVGLRWRFRAPLFVALESQLQLAEPYVSIHFAETVVASTGRPNLALALTAGAWL
ncbi:MAG: hypothetical protein ACOY0T_10515 [Myxococcota bacterium]